MSARAPRGGAGGGGARPYAIRLDAEACGALLGALTWALGALAILRDRGHAMGDERGHGYHDQLAPALERLISEVGGVRAAAGADPAREAAVEAAYAQLREAFEAWIQLTAADTAAVAIAQVLEQRLDEQDKGGDASGQ
ncbi:MAG: hypothetical protein EXR63_04230 [Dehalococcoidia bacterium]|nr:hypothetical protein [Dehalococcoidia bacterium]